MNRRIGLFAARGQALSCTREPCRRRVAELTHNSHFGVTTLLCVFPRVRFARSAQQTGTRTMRSVKALALFVALLLFSAVPAAATTYHPTGGPVDHGQRLHPDEPPIVIAHRGASGYRPEHTLPAYELAIEMGADYVEPDLVMTSDGHLIARHDNVLNLTTDVADRPDFADRETTKTVDGVEVTGWFSEDFTLEEIKSLRAIERIPDTRPGNTVYDTQFEVPTLEEILTLVQEKEAELGRTIGIYPETKHPTHFAEMGLDMNAELVRVLDSFGYSGADDPVFIQSFEVTNLQQLDTMTELALVQLLWIVGQPYDAEAAGESLTYEMMGTSQGLAEIATYADGVGPEKSFWIIPRDENGEVHLDNATTFVDDAHAVGLLVHPYTFRAENTFLASNFREGAEPTALGDLVGELQVYLQTGIDGFFTDHPDIGAMARDAMMESERRAIRSRKIAKRRAIRLSPRAVDIAVIGDTPYGDEQVVDFPDLVEAINDAQKVRQVVHVGDTKSGGSVCSDAYLEMILDEFENFRDPVVYTPGDNEWTDCHRESAGGYNPVERLRTVRDLYFDEPGRTLGRREAAVVHQSAMYPENVLWGQSEAILSTLHVVGSNNGLAPWFNGEETPAQTKQRLAEVRSRTNAALAWINYTFDVAREQNAQGVAIFMQADMWDQFSLDTGRPLDGFDAIVQLLAERTLAFDGEVILFEGDSHSFIDDNPVANGDDVHGVLQPVPNLRRIVVEGVTTSEWTRLRIDPRAANLFTVTREQV